MKKIVLTLSCFLLTATWLLAQKGQASLSVGPLVSIPAHDYIYRSVKTGTGLEVSGQYGVSPKSNVVVQAAFIRYPNDYAYRPLTILNLKGGYRYQFGASGFYLNGLAGTELDLSDGYATIAFTIGGGKRFTFNNGRQLDAGIDYLTGDVWVDAINLKVALLLFKKQRTKD